jgi:hypothetical protein
MDMNKTSVKKLLKQIKVEKSAATPLGALGDDLRMQVNQQMQSDAIKTLLKAVALSAGAGAAIRGVTGLFEGPRNPKKGPRVIDMPVAYPKEKNAIDSNSRATSPYGLDYYLPSLMLGAPLAAYGGWKGVDLLLNKVKERESKAKLESSKKKYEEALLGAYKQATDDCLDQAFAGYRQKAALDPIGAISDKFNSTFPNASGLSKGLALTWLLSSAPAGYYLVNKAMKKNSRRAILEEAVEERARRQALVQPPEIYATPYAV